MYGEHFFSQIDLNRKWVKWSTTGLCVLCLLHPVPQHQAASSGSDSSSQSSQFAFRAVRATFCNIYLHIKKETVLLLRRLRLKDPSYGRGTEDVAFCQALNFRAIQSGSKISEREKEVKGSCAEWIVGRVCCWGAAVGIWTQQLSQEWAYCKNRKFIIKLLFTNLGLWFYPPLHKCPQYALFFVIL